MLRIGHRARSAICPGARRAGVLLAQSRRSSADARRTMRCPRRGRRSSARCRSTHRCQRRTRCRATSRRSTIWTGTRPSVTSRFRWRNRSGYPIAAADVWRVRSSCAAISSGPIALAERAIEEDPLEVWPRMNLHAYLQAAGRDKDAYAQATEGPRARSRISWSPACRSRTSTPTGASSRRRWPRHGRPMRSVRGIRMRSPRWRRCCGVSGEEDEARALYQSLGTGKDFGDCRAQAVYHLLCGDVDTGADWAEKAIAERDHSMMYYLRFVISTGAEGEPPVAGDRPNDEPRESHNESQRAAAEVEVAGFVADLLGSPRPQTYAGSAGRRECRRGS